MPSSLEGVQAEYRTRVDALVTALEKGFAAGRGTRAANQFADGFYDVLQRANASAFRAGLRGKKLDAEQQQALVDIINEQLRYADRFIASIRNAKEFGGAWRARANLYGSALSQAWNAGAHWDVYDVLPAVPGDGTTQCLVNCKCRWDIRRLRGTGNFDCYWRLGEAEHCDTCKARARRWRPLRIRGGKIKTTLGTDTFIK